LIEDRSRGASEVGQFQIMVAVWRGRTSLLIT
jgi:hypothetical protein